MMIIIRSGNCGKLFISFKNHFYIDMILRIIETEFLRTNNGGKLWKMQ